MDRKIRPALLITWGALLLLIVPPAAQAAPPSCPDAFLITTPGQRIALAGNPCTDADGDSYDLAFVMPPSKGTIVPEGPTNYYTPSPGSHGYDEFTYQATTARATTTPPNGEKSNIATVDILIDTPPECADGSATVQSGNTLTLPELCHDADGDDFVEFIGDPQHGTLVFSPDGITVTYTPAAGYVGTDTISYEAEDSFGRISQVRTLTITVTAPPPPPPVVASAAPLPIDATPPELSLVSTARKLKSVRIQGLRLALTTNEGGAASVTLTVGRATARKLKIKRGANGPVAVGSSQLTLAGGSSTVTVKLTAKARKALKKARKVKLLVTAVITDAAGNSTTKTLVVVLTR